MQYGVVIYLICRTFNYLNLMNYMRKNIVIIFCITCILLACKNSNTSISSILGNSNSMIANEFDNRETADLPEFLFENLSYNFGEVVQGEQLNYIFHFKNVGKSNLIIYEIGASCGCTRPIPSKEPIAPGEKGEIAIIVDTEEKNIGEMVSYVVITANTFPEQTILTLHANVLNP